jgi:hypothetical protein
MLFIQMTREIRLDDGQATSLPRHGANAGVDEEDPMRVRLTTVRPDEGAPCAYEAPS